MRDEVHEIATIIWLHRPGIAPDPELIREVAAFDLAHVEAELVDAVVERVTEFAIVNDTLAIKD